MPCHWSTASGYNDSLGNFLMATEFTFQNSARHILRITACYVYNTAMCVYYIHYIAFMQYVIYCTFKVSLMKL